MLMTLVRKWLSDSQLWINPDRRLKTRSWEEVRPALVNMVAAPRELRRVLMWPQPQSSVP